MMLVCFRFNNELVLGICLLIQAASSALIPVFGTIAMMCIMFVGQGFAIGVVGIGKLNVCALLPSSTFSFPLFLSLSPSHPLSLSPSLSWSKMLVLLCLSRDMRGEAGTRYV